MFPSHVGAGCEPGAEAHLIRAVGDLGVAGLPRRDVDLIPPVAPELHVQSKEAGLVGVGIRIFVVDEGTDVQEHVAEEAHRRRYQTGPEMAPASMVPCHGT